MNRYNTSGRLLLFPFSSVFLPFLVEDRLSPSLGLFLLKCYDF